MKTRIYQIAVVAVMLLSCEPASAGVLDKIVRAAGGVMMKKASGEAAEQGSKAVAKRITQEALEVTNSRLATRAAIGLTDDAVRLTGSKAAALALADDVAVVGGKVSAQNLRRLSMMADDIERSGKAPELMQLLAKNSAADQVVDFLWRNKATIASGALLTTVVLNPDIIKESTTNIGESIVETAGREIVHPLIGGSMFGAWMFVIIGVFVIAGALSIWLRPRIWRRLAAWAIVASAK